MIYGFGYVVGKEGEKFWGENLRFFNLTPLHISKDKIENIRNEFYNNQTKNFLGVDKYLVEGVYFEFVESEGNKMLSVKTNTINCLEKVAKQLNLPTKENNKANLSAQNEEDEDNKRIYKHIEELKNPPKELKEFIKDVKKS